MSRANVERDPSIGRCNRGIRATGTEGRKPVIIVKANLGFAFDICPGFLLVAIELQYDRRPVCEAETANVEIDGGDGRRAAAVGCCTPKPSSTSVLPQEGDPAPVRRPNWGISHR
jgi:hypothetical protein